jgi:hypothetical protein
MTLIAISSSIKYPTIHNIRAIVTFLIILFTYVSIILFFTIFILRVRKNKFEERVKKLKSLLDSILMNAAFASTQEELDEIIFRAQPKFLLNIRNPSLAYVINKEIINMHRSLTGQSRDNLSQLFKRTCLLQYTLRNLRNPNWHIKANAVRNISEISTDTPIPKLEKYAVHRNMYLQEEAQIAMVNIKGFEGLEFLNELENALSDWQQINILDILKALDKDNAPDFGHWLTHKEDSVKLFAIRLISYFQQAYNGEKLKLFVNHENSILRKEAISALQKITFDYDFGTLNNPGAV